jgi:hypothetical protein
VVDIIDLMHGNYGLHRFSFPQQPLRDLGGSTETP